jgi:hypothetical protein
MIPIVTDFPKVMGLSKSYGNFQKAMGLSKSYGTFQKLWDFPKVMGLSKSSIYKLGFTPKKE